MILRMACVIFMIFLNSIACRKKSPAESVDNIEVPMVTCGEVRPPEGGLREVMRR